MGRTLDVTTSWMASIARGGAGMRASHVGARPAKRLELYEFEACPFCRRVREMLTALDLEARILPCPKGGDRFRSIVRARGGKEQFPYLVDANTGDSLYESSAIVAHLSKHYGEGGRPFSQKIGGALPAGMLASAVRATKGGRARRSRAPEKDLELWSFEASPYCRLVREALCELELPYVLHNVGKGSPSRDAFVARSNRMMVPYLADPNTSREMFESKEIVRYLNETYAT